MSFVPVLSRKKKKKAASGNVAFQDLYVNRSSAGDNVIDVRFNGAVPGGTGETGFTLEIAAPVGSDQSYTSIDAGQYATSIVDTDYLRFTLSGGEVNDVQSDHLIRVSHDGTQTGIDTFTNETWTTSANNDSSVNLFDGLLRYYLCDETSGVLTDWMGSTNLTDNNAVTSGTGINGKTDGARQYTKADTEYHNASYEAAWAGGDVHYLIAARMYPDTTTTVMYVAALWDGSGNRLGSMSIKGGVDDKILARWLDSTSTQRNIVSGSALTDGTWNDAWMWHDPDADECGLRWNGNTETPVSFSGGLTTDTGYGLGVGGNALGSLTFDGRIDGVGIWRNMSDVMTAGEYASWRASGNGNDPPFKPRL